MTSQTPRFYQFGEFRLDAEGRRLLKQNQEISLTPKAFDTLLELVKLKGRVLDREELMRKVWPNSFVEEGNIKVTIFNLRKALEDNPAEMRLIQTVPRHGYRFAAEVVEIDDMAEAELGLNSEKQTTDAEIKSLAVLPLKVIGGVADEYLGLGLADALIIKLSGVKDIVIRPTSAVRKYVDLDEGALNIARHLQVEAVLEGHIYRAGDRVRVTIQLISAIDGRTLWADKFDEWFIDIFDVEDSISEQVAQALMLELSGTDRRRLTKRYTENIEAYQLYLKGRYHWAKRLSQGTRIAAEQFRAAIDLDPNYTLAYAGLADCYAQLAWLTLMAPSDTLPVAKAAAERALELDPLLAEAHASLAWIHLIYDLDYSRSEAAFRRSLELNPNYSVARMWFGVLHIATERFSEAIEELNIALSLDPLSPIINALVGWPFYFMREYEPAIELFKKAIELEPRSLPAHYLLGTTYLQTGSLKEAINEMRTARDLDDSSLMTLGLAQAYAVSDAPVQVKQLMNELSRSVIEKGKYVSPYDEAGLYLRLGDYDRAINKLEDAFSDRSAWRIFLPVDPKFDVLRGDERFVKLLQGMGKRAAA